MSFMHGMCSLQVRSNMKQSLLLSMLSLMSRFKRVGIVRVVQTFWVTKVTLDEIANIRVDRYAHNVGFSTRLQLLHAVIDIVH